MPGGKGTSWGKPKWQPSRENVQCIVPGCERNYRRDKINAQHYTKLVVLDNSSKPLRPGSKLYNDIESEEIRNHTRFFYENELDPLTCKDFKKRPQQKMNPFQQMEARKKRKMQEPEGLHFNKSVNQKFRMLRQYFCIILYSI